MVYKLLKIFIDPVYLVLFLNILAFIFLFLKVQRRIIKFFIILAIILSYLVTIAPISNSLCYFLEKDYLSSRGNIPQNLDILVVPGGGIYQNDHTQETLLSPQSALRIFYAIEMFKKSDIKYLVCMGKGGGDKSEAEIMASIAEKFGIPAAKIKVDSLSDNTLQHAKVLNSMFNNKDIKMGLVTSAYHMKRSEKEFKKYFSNISPMPSDYLFAAPAKVFLFDLLPSSANLNKLTMALHEIVGMFWYKVKS